jgi:hypothetical protein
VTAGANVVEQKPLKATIEAIVVERPDPSEVEQNLSLDKAYDNPNGRAAASEAGYTPHIRRIGEEKKGCDRSKGHTPRRWVVEIVWTQMTKPDVLALGGGLEDVADLDLVARHDDSVDEQFHQLSPLIEGGALKSGGDPLAERFQWRRQPERLVEPVGLAGEPPLLLGEWRVSDPDLAATTLILGERDDAAQVGLGQPLELLGQRRLPLAQTISPRLEFLRVPGADRREPEGLRHGRRVP